MTEEEAKAKWCPFAQNRIVSWRKSATETVNAVFSGGEGAAPTTNCIGSSCMAWREDQGADLAKARALAAADLKLDAIKALREARPGLGLLAAKEIVISGDWPAYRGGFCGLAGTPQ